MFDIITNNIFILIPLAIFIAFRILEARKKHRDSAPEKKPVLKEEHESGSLPHWEAEKQERFSGHGSAGISPSGVPLTSRMPVEVSPRLLSETGFGSMTQPASVAQPPERSSAAFPQNLSYLPSLKRALVMTEILGPPKGLQE